MLYEYLRLYAKLTLRQNYILSLHCALRYLTNDDSEYGLGKIYTPWQL